ncbi:TetR/AcrR family transcriptional regulator [Saccharothrix coeruleofusca]|uniref:TetR family transcriptional regulator n=1 Tax=Saccharothrix coeruleofusca TaxID=33919 RepID=A0A918EHX5_9PSEU|nr:TetR/AcrR family transcriptional regulator [Saccharothrix coeruleofusca]GGP85787.1 TetR family transcriptional regulator [Saccharothrix coeruleofusca]
MKGAAYHHGDLRASLLRSALELVETTGSDQLSLRSVARAAGVSPNAPYRHYADKDDLLAAVAVHGFQQVGARIAAAAAQAGPDDRLVRVVSAAIHYAMANPGLFHLMVGRVCGTNAAARAAARDVVVAVAEALEVDLGEPQGEALCTGIWAVVQGMSVLLVDGALKPHEGQDVDELIGSVVRATFGTWPRA